MIEPIIKLTLAVYENPGVYALLLGSGISRAANIPTGWEIMNDLITKVANLYSEDVGESPETWYIKYFREDPNYSRILEELAPTRTERMRLLNSYFEADEEDQATGSKQPTDAHRVIARLVREGYIRIILTTNFDRLLENALRDEGIEPDIVCSDDSLNGALPFCHSDCYIVKLHGDYKDSRIKNSHEELMDYSEAINQLLDRILDEHGLIICGWSATWDVALRCAIQRCPNRRFSMYWLSKGELTEASKLIIEQRHAEVINIESANHIFTELWGKVISMQEIKVKHPISSALAVSECKKYLSDPVHRIRLHDFLMNEIARALSRIPDIPSMRSSRDPYEDFVGWIQKCNAIMDIPNSIIAAIAFHGSTMGHAKLLCLAIERLFNMDLYSIANTDTAVYKYPALLALYIGGISALASNNFTNLAELVLQPQYYERYEKKPVLKVLNARVIFYDTGLERCLPERRPNESTPVNSYLYKIAKKWVCGYIPEEKRYECMFDIFEYILAVSNECLIGKRPRGPLGCFELKYGDFEADGLLSPIDQFLTDGIGLGDKWDPLKNGFFGGNTTDLNRLIKEYRIYNPQSFKTIQESDCEC